MGTVPTPLPLDQGGAGIIDGTEQAGDVPQWAGFGAALGDRGRRFALEIDDVSVAAGDQHLAEMEIAVNARHQCADAAPCETFYGCQIAARVGSRALSRARDLVRAAQSRTFSRAAEGFVESLFGFLRPLAAVSSTSATLARTPRRKSAAPGWHAFHRADGRSPRRPPRSRSTGRTPHPCGSGERLSSARVSWSSIHDQASP